eukprot:3338948-Prymnesium_polylepis.1
MVQDAQAGVRRERPRVGSLLLVLRAGAQHVARPARHDCRKLRHGPRRGAMVSAIAKRPFLPRLESTWPMADDVARG